MKKNILLLTTLVFVTTNSTFTMEQTPPPNSDPKAYLGAVAFGIVTTFTTILYLACNPNKPNTNPSEEKILLDKELYKKKCIYEGLQLLPQEEDFNFDEGNLKEFVQKIKDLDFNENTFKKNNNKITQENCLYFYDKLQNYEEDLQKQQEIEIAQNKEGKKSLLKTARFFGLATAICAYAGL